MACLLKSGGEAEIQERRRRAGGGGERFRGREGESVEREGERRNEVGKEGEKEVKGAYDEEGKEEGREMREMK